MKLLQLTVIVRDVQTATMQAQSFTRSPVLVGRQFGNHLRLDARIVSRRHGAFLFSKDGLQYLDYNSANGTFIDGARVDPNQAIDVRDSSVITIAPFQLVAHVDLVDTHRLSNDPNASTPLVAVLRPEPKAPEVRSWQHVLANGAAVQHTTSLRESRERLERALRALQVVADALLAAGSRTATTRSPLRLAADADEMVAVLLDASTADQRRAELRDLLAELLRPRLKSIP
jgi:pSer/pThr/pTyr-binding forkhead associated (FHA) protein